MPRALTHVDERGAARMVDVSAKPVTSRTATATGRVRTTADVVALRGRVPRNISRSADLDESVVTLQADASGTAWVLMTATDTNGEVEMRLGSVPNIIKRRGDSVATTMLTVP